MTIRNGQIVHSRDDASLLPAVQATGRLRELFEALGAPADGWA